MRQHRQLFLTEQLKNSWPSWMETKITQMDQTMSYQARLRAARAQCQEYTTVARQVDLEVEAAALEEHRPAEVVAALTAAPEEAAAVEEALEALAAPAPAPVEVAVAVLEDLAPTEEAPLVSPAPSLVAVAAVAEEEAAAVEAEEPEQLQPMCPQRSGRNWSWSNQAHGRMLPHSWPGRMHS
jgi:hypothetical protein